MHEASLIANLLHQIEDAARTEHARRVTGVSVWLGALSHMSSEHFGEHFARVATGTIADGARLDVTLSNDISHANAQDIMLESVEMEV